MHSVLQGGGIPLGDCPRHPWCWEARGSAARHDEPDRYSRLPFSQAGPVNRLDWMPSMLMCVLACPAPRLPVGGAAVVAPLPVPEYKAAPGLAWFCSPKKHCKTVRGRACRQLCSAPFDTHFSCFGPCVALPRAGIYGISHITYASSRAGPGPWTAPRRCVLLCIHAHLAPLQGQGRAWLLKQTP